MSTHTTHNENFEVYFCTVTCYRWLPLFEVTQSYDSVYSWFDYLARNNCQIIGYVMMPNHFHVLIFPTEGSINKMVSNGKRFMAYAIVKKLKGSGNRELLTKLEQGVQPSETKKGKKHQVFRLSFDARVCYDEKMLEQKLDYIHRNPVSGRWHLTDDYTRYLHSSAGFYELGAENDHLRHYKEIFAT